MVDLSALFTSVYDEPYEAITALVIQAIVSGGTSGLIAQRLAEVDAEAQRLADAGEPLTADNPVVRALLADFETTMLANGALVQSIAPDLMLAGIMAGLLLAQELALPGLEEATLEALGWVTLNAEELTAALNYVNSEAFATLLSEYGAGTLEQIKNIILNGIAQGKGPLAIADDLIRAVQGLPAVNAQQIMRTLQLVSSRDAQLAARIANEEILEYQIRIAALDARTCPTCIALHGTVYPINVRIDDHHNGRCTSVTKVKGFPAPEVQTGTEWFAQLSETEQQQILGPSAWRAWVAGAITLDDFVMEYEDEVFGTMIGTKSLVGILGEAAENYK